MRDMLDAAAPVPLPAAGTPPGLSPAGTAGPGPPPPPDVAVTRQRAQALAEEGTARAEAATAEPPEVQALLAHHGLDWRTGMSDGLPGGLAAFAATGTAASAAVDDLVADLAGVFFTPAAAHAGYPTPAPPTQPVAYGATARPAAGAAPPRVTAPPKTAGGTKRAPRDKTPPLAYDSDSDDDGDAAPALTKVDLPGGVTHELFEVMSRGRTPEPAALRKLLGKAPPLRPLELAPNATMRADVHPTLRPAAWRDDVFDSAALHNDHWFREYAKLHGVARAESAWLAEVKGIYGQGTVGEVELPLDARVQVLKCHSVYKRKPPSVNFPDGRDKARAVVGGDKQVDGVDTSRHERPAPTGMCLSQRMLDILAVTTGRRLRVVDVKMAFLNAPMGKLIYVQPLNGVNLGVGPNGRPIVWVLFTALYGIAEAPQAWYLEYARFLESIGYRRTTADMALFVRVDEATAEVHMCLVHVDDTKMLMSDVEQTRFIAALLAGPAKAGIDDLGSDFGECCGVGYDVTPRGYHLHLRRFIDACAERFNLRGASPCSTPLPERVDPVGDAEHAALSPGEIKLWEQIVGCLQWAATTQVVPGLAFSSSFLGMPDHVRPAAGAARDALAHRPARLRRTARAQSVAAAPPRTRGKLRLVARVVQAHAPLARRAARDARRLALGDVLRAHGQRRALEHGRRDSADERVGQVRRTRSAAARLRRMPPARAHGPSRRQHRLDPRAREPNHAHGDRPPHPSALHVLPRARRPWRRQPCVGSHPPQCLRRRHQGAGRAQVRRLQPRHHRPRLHVGFLLVFIFFIGAS